MNILAVISLLVILSLTNGQKLTCLLCETTDAVCDDNKTTICDDSTFTCYAAKVVVSGEVRYKKGCGEKADCAGIKDLCPGRVDRCLGAGCCHTSGCQANITLFPQPSSTPAVIQPATTEPAQPTSTPAPPVPPTEPATSKPALVPTSTQAVMQTTPTPQQSQAPEPVTPSSTEKSTTGNQTVPQVFTEPQLLDSTTAEPTCSGMRYACSPLIVLLVVIAALLR